MGILQDQGNLLREPYSKNLEDGIYEIRVKISSDIARVLYFFYFDGRIIFTNGYIKKTNKMPKSEIQKAKKYRADFLERYGDNEKVR